MCEGSLGAGGGKAGFRGWWELVKGGGLGVWVEKREEEEEDWGTTVF